MPDVAGVPATNNQDINGVLTGVRWAAGGLTYSFPTDASFYEYGQPWSDFAPLNNAQQTAVSAILSLYASFANLNFAQTTETASNHGDLRFAMSSGASPTAYAYYPSTDPSGGDSWYGPFGSYDSPIKASYAFLTFIHEIGHALGLKHGHETDVYGAMTFAHNSMEYSVMTYRSYTGASVNGGYTNETWGFAQTPMMYDIAALQYMYGANYGSNAGNTVYSWSSSTGEQFVNGVGQGAPGDNRIFMTLWDGGGNDTYDFSNYSTNLIVDLRPGGWTTTSSTQLAKLHFNGSQTADGNIANALLYNNNPLSLIENAIGGSGDDDIVGNVANNILMGGAGNDGLWGDIGDDILDGGIGSDMMSGGPGNDTFYVDVLGDAANENSGEGIYDYIFASVNYTLPVNTEILVLSGPTASGNGNAADNIIYGNAANNILDGLGGGDAMLGYAGEDWYYVDSLADGVIENLNQGSDYIFSSLDYMLSDNVEILVLFGAAVSGIGNSIDNIIYGTATGNVLNGSGGGDVMVGYAGNDWYYVDNLADGVIEKSESGQRLYLFQPGLHAVGQCRNPCVVRSRR